MKLVFAKSKWERWNQPLAPFLDDARAAGFEATEIFLPAMQESPAECSRLHRESGLALVGQILTEGRSWVEHSVCLEKDYLRALECGAILVNCHTGRDIWSFEDNQRLFDLALELEARHGISLCHETHRSRALFAAHTTKPHLDARPALKITADFSHWFCVHESDLADQGEAITAAIAITGHIHARVGHSQGPEVPDPRVTEWRSWLDLSLGLWSRIVEARRSAGEAFLTITPEFGPPPYMPTLPLTGQPLADPWEINCWMAGFLRDELAQFAKRTPEM